MQCSICKNGTTKNSIITVPLVKGDSVLIVKGVPAEVCENCGEYYLDEKTTHELYELAQQSFQSGAELEVINLKAA